MKREFIKRIIRVVVSILIITNMCYMPVSAKWINDSKNNWNWIENQAKATGWRELDKKWYYFNEYGIMSTGWLSYNGKWYNLSNSGEMNTGWKNINENWYHFNSDGVMSMGWIDDGGTWYYTNFNGQMETGTIGIDGQVYTFSNSGAMIDNKKIIQEIQPVAENVNNVKNNQDTYADTNPNIDNPPIKDNPLIKDNNVDVKDEEGDLMDDSLDKGVIRNTEPNLDNKHYYSDMNFFYKWRLSPPFFSDGNLIKGNCTWYAWGRAWEITGSKPDDAGFTGNGYQWWDANKKSKKYQYGSQPRVGSIAVWKPDLPNSGGCGHVAIVEKIENGKIYISESMWHGVTFKYEEIYETSYLYGYIYLDKPNY